MDSSVKEAHRNGDGNLTEREIDLAYGLKDKEVSMIFSSHNISHNIFNYVDIHVHLDEFHFICIL